MIKKGQITFGTNDGISYGRPAAEVVTSEVERHGFERVFLLVSGTLDRETEEIEKVQGFLGDRVVGKYAKMPPHVPRQQVIEVANKVRETKAQLIVTFGGGSVTDGAK